MRRKTTRIYNVATDTVLQLSKEWSMKYGQYLYRATLYGDDSHSLGLFPSFKEARQFVREYHPHERSD